jgi:hypothetical protein
MKQNPFYGLSATAMLGGCYLLSHALKVVPGQLGKLLCVVAVLQLYEVLLALLGVFLLRTGRARRDGTMVLMLETLFLVDAPLLALECVTVDARAGTLLSLGLAALALGKLEIVQRALPGLVSRRLLLTLGPQICLVAALPVVGAQLASARLLTPTSLYGLWWVALALPHVPGRLIEETSSPGGAPSSGHRAWAWIAPASVVLHLWATGWIHQVPFQLAFVAPLLLGFALAARRDQVVRQIAFPAAAVVLSLGQSAHLGHVLTAPTGAPVSALNIALLGAGATYAALAWIHGYGWLVALAALSATATVAGAIPNPVDGLSFLVRLAGRLVPRTALGWGAGGIGAAFGLLAVGAWRSLGGSWPPARGKPSSRARSGSAGGQSGVTVALVLGFLSTGTALSALASHSFAHPELQSSLLDAGAMAVASIIVARRAQSRLSVDHGATARTVASVGVAASVATLVVCAPVLALAHTLHPGRGESAVIGEIRTVLSAQKAYRGVNHGLADARLLCLASPAKCVPGYPADGAAFLDVSLTRPPERRGYRFSLHPGSHLAHPPEGASPTSVESFAYVAVPVSPGSTGVRGFCGDSAGHLCFTTDGSPPRVLRGTCDLKACAGLE